MVINRLQKQLYNKEQRAKKQRSLTTMATIVTEPAFVEMVKEIKQAAKEKKAKKEATQIACTRKKALRDLRTAWYNDEEGLEDTPALPVRAPRTHQGVVCKNYYEDSDAEYVP